MNDTTAAVAPSPAGELHLMPAVHEIVDVESGADASRDNGMVLERFYGGMLPLYHQYDYVIVDCPPNVHRVAEAAIMVFSEIYVPYHLDEPRGLQRWLGLWGHAGSQPISRTTSSSSFSPRIRRFFGLRN